MAELTDISGRGAKIIQPEDVFKKSATLRRHTFHCGPAGIHVTSPCSRGSLFCGEETCEWAL